jgi:hypothetical protein
MKLTRLLFFPVLACFLAAAATAEPLQDAKHPEFGADGFTTVFDGKDLSKVKTKGNWQVQEDGSLKLVPRAGEKGWTRYPSYLWLPGDYGDFVVDFEFQYGKGGNSGFYFRISDEKDATASGHEIQILDSHGAKKALGHHDMGGVLKTNAPLGNASKPAGEWSRMTVSLKDGQLKVILNGKLVQDFKLAEKLPANKELVAKGKIAIQDHGQPFSVRKIQVKSLE